MKHPTKGRSEKGLQRREFLKISIAAGASLAAPTIFTRSASAQQERVLKIVQWKHFVPDYDKWFDVFAKEFGEKNKCKVEVDYVATPDLPTSIAADISRGGGHAPTRARAGSIARAPGARASPAPAPGHGPRRRRAPPAPREMARSAGMRGRSARARRGRARPGNRRHSLDRGSGGRRLPCP